MSENDETLIFHLQPDVQDHVAHKVVQSVSFHTLNTNNRNRYVYPQFSASFWFKSSKQQFTDDTRPLSII